MNFTTTRGDSRIVYFDVTLSGVPLDLTGYLAWFTAKYAQSDPDTSAVIRKGMSGGLTGVTIIVGPTGVNNRIKAVIAPTDTVSITRETRLYFDVQIKATSGDIYTITRGELLVVPDITLATA